MIDWSNFNSSILIKVTRPKGVFTCSGVAINSTTIVTAAHCLEGEILKVRVSLDTEYNPKGKFLAVEGFELHPEYNRHKSNYRNDLARLQLKRELPSNINFYPILKKTNDLHGRLIRLGFGGRDKKNVRTMVTPVLRKHDKFEDILELDDMYSFSGDSGGPIFLQQNGQMYLVAVHSTLSFGPGGKYSYNPLLSRHKTWLEGSAQELSRAV